MYAIAHVGCTDTVRESALKVDSGRKIPDLTGDSNLRQYGALAFYLDARPTELPPPHLLISRLQWEVQILTWNPRSTQVMEVMAYVWDHRSK